MSLHSRLVRILTTLTTLTVACGALAASGRQDARPASADHWDCPDEMHASFVARFEASPGFGVSRMPTKLMLDRSGVLDVGGAAWAIERIELIGLMRHAPSAYVLGGHGAGVGPFGVTPRDLTRFEIRAVSTVRDAGGMLCDAPDAASTIDCVGALQAKPDCLACHQDRKAGEVIGAFSYRLRPARTAR